MKNLTKTSYFGALVLLVLPVVTQAQGLSDLIGRARSFIEALVPLIIGLAVLYFLWGVLKYVVAKDSEDQKEARSVMVMGVIVLFVMVSVWGLVNLLGDTIGINRGTGPGSVDLIP